MRNDVTQVSILQVSDRRTQIISEKAGGMVQNEFLFIDSASESEDQRRSYTGAVDDAPCSFEPWSSELEPPLLTTPPHQREDV
ncbi:hypothetical protein TNCV_730421 [Trichonephila clavipes]|nr:hypothetical protein TNCV_730421 [Trichonephila clavipes]